MLGSHSEKLLDILVPLLHALAIVHSLMCCFSVRSNDEFLAPLFTFLFFHIVYTLSPAYNSPSVLDWLTSPSWQVQMAFSEAPTTLRLVPYYEMVQKLSLLPEVSSADSASKNLRCLNLLWLWLCSCLCITSFCSDFFAQINRELQKASTSSGLALAWRVPCSDNCSPIGRQVTVCSAFKPSSVLSCIPREFQLWRHF